MISFSSLVPVIYLFKMIDILTFILFFIFTQHSFMDLPKQFPCLVVDQTWRLFEKHCQANFNSEKSLLVHNLLVMHLI